MSYYTPRSDRARATHDTHEERLHAMDALEPDALVAFATRKAKQQDMPWLQSMFDEGLFDVPKTIHLDRDALPLEGMPVAPGAWCIDALSGVMQGARFMDGMEQIVPVLEVSDSFRAFFLKVVQQAALDFQHAIDRAETDGTRWTLDQKNAASATRNNTFRILLATACAIDHGDAVRALATPALARQWVNLESVGGIKTSLKSSGGAYGCNAPLVAVLFSAHAALDALRENGCQAAPMVLHPPEAKLPQIWDSRLPLIADDTPDMRIALLAHMLGHGLCPSASMMARAIEETKQEGHFHPMDTSNLTEAAYIALAGNSTVDQEAVRGFLAAGVYDIDPSYSLKKALIHRNTQVLDHFAGREFWAEVFIHREDGLGSFLSSLMKDNHAIQHAGACGPLFAKFMRDAEAAGFGDCLYRCDAAKPTADLAVRHGYLPVLLAHLDHGLDARAPLRGADTFSALELAQSLNRTEAVHMIHAHLARSAAHELLHDIDRTTTP